MSGESVMAGKPVVKGTRLAVEFVVDLLAQGWPESEVLRNYPGLPRMTKVPRRGTTSLAVGETHGQGPSNKIAYRPRRGRTPSIPTQPQTKFNPFGVGKPSGRIVSVGFTHG